MTWYRIHGRVGDLVRLIRREDPYLFVWYRESGTYRQGYIPDYVLAPCEDPLPEEIAPWLEWELTR